MLLGRHTEFRRLGFRKGREDSSALRYQVDELLCVSRMGVSRGGTRWKQTGASGRRAKRTYFSSRYSSPKLTNAVSYSLMAASEVTEGGLEIISLYRASVFRGSVDLSFLASFTLSESPCAMAEVVVVG